MDFYSTRAGAALIEQQIPQAVKALTRIADSLQFQNENSGIKPIDLKVFIDKDNANTIRIFSDTQLPVKLEFVEMTDDEKNLYSPESYLRRVLHCDGYIEIKPEAAGEESSVDENT